MRTVYRAVLNSTGTRGNPWIDAMYDYLPAGTEVHVTRSGHCSQNFRVVSPADLAGFHIAPGDLDFFESWVEWPDGAQLVSSTYTAERLLPPMD